MGLLDLFESHPSLIGLVLDQPVNIYASRNDRQPPVAVLPVGAEVEIDDTADDPDGKRYTKVRMPSGQWGYITGDSVLYVIAPVTFLEDADLHAEPSASSPVKAHYKKGSQVWFWQPKDGWFKTRDRHGNEGYTPSTAHVHLSMAVEKLALHYTSGNWGATMSAVVQREPLNVYRNADDSQAPLAVLNIGAEVKLVGQTQHGGKKYVKLKLPSGQEAWIAVMSDGTIANLFGILPRVLLNDVDMHAEQNESSPVKARYTKGTVVFLLPGGTDGWTQIRDYHGSEGFVAGARVRATRADMEIMAGSQGQTD